MVISNIEFDSVRPVIRKPVWGRQMVHFIGMMLLVARLSCSLNIKVQHCYDVCMEDYYSQERYCKTAGCLAIAAKDANDCKAECKIPRKVVSNSESVKGGIRKDDGRAAASAIGHGHMNNRQVETSSTEIQLEEIGSDAPLRLRTRTTGEEPDPLPPSIAPISADIGADPSYSLHPPRLAEDRLFRPRTISGRVQESQTTSMGRRHDNRTTVQLFLHRNGFSDEPFVSRFSRQELCSSEATISEKLSRIFHVGCEVEQGHLCRVFLQNGWEVDSCHDLEDNDHVWLVRPHRDFIWPTFDVGTKVEVRHISTPNNQPIIVQTMAERPPVFEIHNLFTEEEAQEVLNIASDQLTPHTVRNGKGALIQRSTRTSYKYEDTSSPVSMIIKRRALELLGIRPYEEERAEGLKVLRYHPGQAFFPHTDYHVLGGRFDSSKPGGVNRAATLLLYLSDVEDGGQTVFPKVGLQVDEKKALEMVRLKYNLSAVGIEAGSWQEDLLAACKSKFAIKPQRLKTALFYTQGPTGKKDDMALHGGCPVMQGVKWSATIWVWNGNPYDPSLNPTNIDDESDSVSAKFITYEAGYSLYWRDTFIGVVGGPEEPLVVDAFVGQSFQLFKGLARKIGPKIMTWTIGGEDKEQVFVYEGSVGHEQTVATSSA